MKQKRIRINLEDTEGAKFKFDIEGNVTKDKVLKLFELMDLMNIEEEQTPDLDSVGEPLPSRQIHLLRRA